MIDEIDLIVFQHVSGDEGLAMIDQNLIEIGRTSKLLRPITSSPLNMRTAQDFFNDLKDPNIMKKTLETLLSIEDIEFCPRTVKATLAACISSRCVDTTRLFLHRVNQSTFGITPELIYAGLNIATNENACDICEELLIVAFNLRMNIDSYILNNVIQMYVRNKRLVDACNLFEMAQFQEFGRNVRVDVTSYSSIMEAAARETNRDVARRAMALVRSTQRIRPDEDTFMSALTILSFSRDYVGALEVFALYEKSYGTVHARAYISLLSSFVYSNILPKTHTSQPREVDDVIAEKKLDAVVLYLLNRNADTSFVLSNLILQYYCARRDMEKAELYLQRMHNFNHVSTTSSLLAYNELVCGVDDCRRALLLLAYMQANGFTPFSSLTKLVKKCMSYSSTISGGNTAFLEEYQNLQRRLKRLRELLAEPNSEIQLEWVLAILKSCAKIGSHADMISVFQDLQKALQNARVFEIDCIMVFAITEILFVSLPNELLEDSLFRSIFEMFAHLVPELHAMQKRSRQELLKEYKRERASILAGNNSSISVSSPAVVASAADTAEATNVTGTASVLQELITASTFAPKESKPKGFGKPQPTRELRHLLDPNSFKDVIAKLQRLEALSKELLPVNFLTETFSLLQVNISAHIQAMDSMLSAAKRANETTVAQVLLQADWYDFRAIAYTAFADIFIAKGDAKSANKALYVLNQMLSEGISPSKYHIKSFILNAMQLKLASSRERYSFTLALLNLLRKWRFPLDDWAYRKCIQTFGAGKGNSTMNVIIFLDMMEADGVEVSKKTQRDLLVTMIESKLLLNAVLYISRLEDSAASAGKSVDRSVYETFISNILKRRYDGELRAIYRHEENDTDDTGVAESSPLGAVVVKSGINQPSEPPLPDDLVVPSFPFSSYAKLLKNFADIEEGASRRANLERIRTGAMMYDKVMNILLETTKKEDLVTLFRILEEKKFRVTSEKAHVLIQKMARKNNTRGAVAAFDYFFPAELINEKCPEIFAVNNLGFALLDVSTKHEDQAFVQASRLKYVPLVKPYVKQLRPLMATSLHNWARHCADVDDFDGAVAFVLACGMKSRDPEMACALAKKGVLARRPDWVLPFLQGSWKPIIECVGMTIGVLSLMGTPDLAAKFEYTLRTVAIGRRINRYARFPATYTVPWIHTFLLFTAAKTGNVDMAHRIMFEDTYLLLNSVSSNFGAANKELEPTKLDCNLALFAYLRGLSRVSESVVSSDITDISMPDTSNQSLQPSNAIQEAAVILRYMILNRFKLHKANRYFFEEGNNTISVGGAGSGGNKRNVSMEAPVVNLEDEFVVSTTAALIDHERASIESMKTWLLSYPDFRGNGSKNATTASTSVLSESSGLSQNPDPETALRRGRSSLVMGPATDRQVDKMHFSFNLTELESLRFMDPVILDFKAPAPLREALEALVLTTLHNVTIFNDHDGMDWHALWKEYKPGGGGNNQASSTRRPSSAAGANILEQSETKQEPSVPAENTTALIATAQSDSGLNGLMQVPAKQPPNPAKRSASSEGKRAAASARLKSEVKRRNKEVK